MRQLDQQIVLALATALKRDRRSSRAAGEIAPVALAEHLYTTSYGLKHRGFTGRGYLDRMRVAVRTVCKSEGR